MEIESLIPQLDDVEGLSMLTFADTFGSSGTLEILHFSLSILMAHCWNFFFPYLLEGSNVLSLRLMYQSSAESQEERFDLRASTTD